jgi:nicotinate-nucleotide adenylyltransferase
VNGRRVGLYGGSFDPIHWGHLRTVQAARSALGLDEVLYLPTARPPHKEGQQLAPALARFAMAEIALLGEPEMRVSDLELLRDGPAYTVESLEHFRRIWPETKLFLLLGSDSLAQLSTWRRWRELPELAELAVLLRPGAASHRAEVVRIAEREPVLRAALEAGRLHIVEGPLLAISSRQVRARLAAGDWPGPEVLPPLVLEYIRKYRLYEDLPERGVVDGK